MAASLVTHRRAVGRAASSVLRPCGPWRDRAERDSYGFGPCLTGRRGERLKEPDLLAFRFETRSTTGDAPGRNRTSARTSTTSHARRFRSTAGARGWAARPP